jgi:hypothetical protein
VTRGAVRSGPDIPFWTLVAAGLPISLIAGVSAVTAVRQRETPARASAGRGLAALIGGVAVALVAGDMRPLSAAREAARQNAATRPTPGRARYFESWPRTAPAPKEGLLCTFT